MIGRNVTTNSAKPKCNTETTNAAFIRCRRHKYRAQFVRLPRMRYSDIVSPYIGTRTHPFLAIVAMKPVHWRTFLRLHEDRPEVGQLRVERTSRDRWTV